MCVFVCVSCVCVVCVCVGCLCMCVSAMSCICVCGCVYMWDACTWLCVWGMPSDFQLSLITELGLLGARANLQFCANDFKTCERLMEVYTSIHSGHSTHHLLIHKQTGQHSAHATNNYECQHTVVSMVK